ncbi:MAG TPA: M20 family metallopeptidase [Flexilinea sp.]|jgi:succinyl-diaminopimelate desuccinylase|nr:M20 family metallopeptidase [Flexilinea sp.]HPR71624.1 M20 family metallopeptidase [Flexilinea sp.]HQF36899.1 M20 family metallopeptidase [Candidatus Dojkabacteria bacterium]
MDQTEALQILIQFLAIPTINGEFNEKNLANFISKIFSDYGIYNKVDVIKSGIANIFSEIPGDDDNHCIAVNGHLDTVPYGDLSKWEHNPSFPFVQNNVIYARGASDMKSGLAAFVVAMCNIKKKGIRPRRNIKFLGTADEEKGGLGASYALEQGILGNPDILIIGEPTNGNFGIAQKGCLWIKLKVIGKTSHGAYPSEGINALEISFELYKRIKRLVAKYYHPLLNKASAVITFAKGGIAPNMVPDCSEIMIDIRSVPPFSNQRIIEEINLIILKFEKRNKGLHIEIEIENDRKSYEINPDSIEIKKIRENCERNFGKIPSNIGINYFSDSSIFAEKMPYVPILLFGPGYQELAHQPNEYIKVSDYLSIIDIYEKILLE